MLENDDVVFVCVAVMLFIVVVANSIIPSNDVMGLKQPPPVFWLPPEGVLATSLDTTVEVHVAALCADGVDAPLQDAGTVC
jgi:hypothetical protein